MKKIATLFIALLISMPFFSQTKVAAKKLSKALDSNKDAGTVFESEISLKGMNVASDGTVTIPSLTKTKSRFVSGMDMTNIVERVSYANKNLVTTFTVKDLASKTYAITNIAGIETVAQYKERYLEEQKAEARKNITKFPVQVIIQESINLAGSEAAWLPGQIQDKLKSNFQEYLGMKTVVDSKSEAALKKLQAESESAARDENTAIELGKITTAKFAVFTKLRKTGSGYTISIDFTDLTTGEQMASTTSKEYSKAEYLYGSTGAVDELTLALANKLGIKISDLNKNLLASGSASFSLDDQLALAKQNEEQFRKQMSAYDAELSKLMTSNDINAVQNKNRIEAEKALLVEKQNAEKKRQEELNAQKARAAEDEKLEAERSIALKTQRDQMAKDAAAKAAEVRRLKMEKQGVLGQINVIESKKKALVEIRQGVESRSVELHEQMLKDKEIEEAKIRNRPLGTSEKDENGSQTERSKQIRENQVIKSNEDLTNKFFVDCDAVKKATANQDASLLAEIRADQKTLATTRTVSSMGDELKVSYGKFTGAKDGWISYISLYSDGILIFTDEFILSYEGITGKRKPTDAELEDFKVSEEYDNNIDMYNSLLTRGDPIIYFEIDYNVTSEADNEPSQYKFNFNKIRVINTISGKVTQTSSLNKVQPRTMKPEWDLREFAGVVEKEKAKFDPEKYPVEVYMAKGQSLENAKKSVAKDNEAAKFFDSMGIKMVNIPGENIKMLNTEVPQKLYTSIMGSNPSYFKGDNNPVDNVSWYDAIYFCNKLSEKFGFTPVYSLNGITDVSKWNYTPHKGKYINGEVTQDTKANGFRLPTVVEWEYAARGGEDYEYAGSDNRNEVGWYSNNSGYRTHPVAQKKANGYGLYDMSGNVWEWCGDVNPRYSGDVRYRRGGCYSYFPGYIGASGEDYDSADNQNDYVGFRIVCNAD